MSKLNCWPGCIAVYKGILLKHHGRIVTVVRATDSNINGALLDPVRGPWWEVAPAINGCTRCADSALRPITPPPGTVTDEEVRELFAPKQPEVA